MQALKLLGVALCCFSCKRSGAEASDVSHTYTLPGGSSIHLKIGSAPADAGSLHGVSMTFPGSPAGSGGHVITESYEYSSTGGPHTTMTQQQTLSTPAMPHPRENIIYGWIPSPQETENMQELNLAELRNALRNDAFVRKLQIVATSQRGCAIIPAFDRESYLHAFWTTIKHERQYRMDADKARWEIEEEMRRENLAASNLRYTTSAATRDALQRNPGRSGISEHEASSATLHAESVDSVLGSRLESLMSCKFAALLGQPGIFLNNQIPDVAALEMVGAALGIGATIPSSDPLAAPAFGGLEPFLMASNPVSLGHLLTLMIGYIDRELFFGPKPSKPFYSFTTLVGATGGETAIEMIDEMCDRDRGPHFKTSLFKSFRPKRMNGKPRARGSSQPWYVRGRSRSHYNKNQPELLRAYCDATEMLLNAMMLKQEEMQLEMHKYAIAVEPLVDPATNAARIQVRTCRGTAPVCDFESSILKPTASPLNPEVIEQNTKTREVFNLYTGLASAQDPSLTQTIATRYGDVRTSQWVETLSRPAAHSEILEKAFYFDTREFIAKKKSKLISQFDDYAKRVQQLKGKSTITFQEAANIYATIQTHVAHDTKKKLFGPSISMKNLFRVATILLLRSNISCDMKSSFAEKLETFSRFMFKSQEQSGRPRPASQRSLMAFFRTGKAPILRSMCSHDPLAFVYLFLYRFVLLGSDAAKTHDEQHAKLKKTRLTTRLLGSKWTPSLLKKLLQGVRRKSMVKQTKQLLLESLDTSVLPSIVNAFDWIVHTQATLAVNQNSLMYHDLGVGPQGYQTSAEKKAVYKLSAGGLAKHTDDQLREWAEHGVPKSIANKLRKGEKLPKKVAYENIPVPDLTRWESQLNAKWLQALNAYLEHPYGKAALAANDPVALVIRDSRNRLEEEMDSTIFLGRIVKPPRVSKLKRALNAVGSFFRSLLRSQSQSEYAVWMGVKVNIDRVMAVMKAVNSAAEVVKSSGMYDYIREAFLEIVTDVVMGNLNSHHRIIAYDTYAAVDEQLRSEGFAAENKRNHGFLALHHGYVDLTEEERKQEFQMSMCMDHCEGLWKLLTSLVLTNLQNPKKLADYEDEMKSSKSIEQLNNPNRVNAFRFGLSVQVDYFDNMLDKGSKSNIKSMKYGGGTWFAYSLLLAGRVNTAMGMPSVGTTFQYQAPYFGNFILKWIKERKEARKKAIFAMLTLGMFYAYTFLSVTDITQHLNDSGLGPAVECLENLVVGPVCPVETVAPAITNAAQAAVQDVFKVGLFGLMTPYLVWPMMLISVWQILKSEFKVLLQFEMSVKSLFSRFSSWVKRPFTNWWQRRRRMKEGIFKKASAKYEQEKAATGKEPQARDFVGRSDSGLNDLASLGVPAPQEVFVFETRAPVYPHSPPLVNITYT